MSWKKIEHPGKDKSSTWPNGEPKSVRDAYDKAEKDKNKDNKKK